MKYYKYIGVDVSKEKIDVAIDHKTYQFPQTEVGLKKIFKKVKNIENQNPLIVFEPTGYYSKPIRTACREYQLAYNQVNPFEAKRYLEAFNKHVKTDKKDAIGLAAYGKTSNLQPMPYNSEFLDKLEDLLSTREFIKQEKINLENRLNDNRKSDEILKKQIDLFKRDLREIDKQLEALIQSNEEAAKLAEVIKKSVVDRGIGIILTTTLIALLPELGRLSGRKISSLVGVAPKDHQSGKKDDARHIFGGRPRVRAALYMVAVGLTRYKSELSDYYQYLRTNPKSPKHAKVAIIALAHKLLLRLNAAVRDYYATLKTQPQI